MIDTQPRTLELGSDDAVWARITDRLGQDLTGVTIELQVIDAAGVEGSWAAPDLTDFTTVGVVRAAVLLEPLTPGWYRLRARITDTPTVTVLTCGGFQVV